MRADEGTERREWTTLLSLLLAVRPATRRSTASSSSHTKLRDGGVTHITVEPPVESEASEEEAERTKEQAKRTYQRSVAVTKEVINSVRMGRSASVKKVKRAVQAIVDQVLIDEVVAGRASPRCATTTTTRSPTP